MKNRAQFNSINNSTSETLNVKSSVPRWYILGPLLFFTNIYDMHLVTEHADMHHFADNTSLLHGHKSIKKINQIIVFEIKKIVHWFRANKISLNSHKIEITFSNLRKKRLQKILIFE